MVTMRCAFNCEMLIDELTLDNYIEAFEKRILGWYFVERVTGHEAYQALASLSVGIDDIVRSLSGIEKYITRLDVVGNAVGSDWARQCFVLVDNGGRSASHGIWMSGTGEICMQLDNGAGFVVDPWVLCGLVKAWLSATCQLMREGGRAAYAKNLLCNVNRERAIYGLSDLQSPDLEPDTSN